MADAVNGRFPVLRTEDGLHWARIARRLPAALPGEAAFAASGTCVATFGQNRAWIATGGAEHARILRTTDGGDTWEASPRRSCRGRRPRASSRSPSATRTTGSWPAATSSGPTSTPTTSPPRATAAAPGGWRRAPRSSAPGGLTYVPRGNGGSTGGRRHHRPGRRRVVAGSSAEWKRIPGAKDYWAAGLLTVTPGGWWELEGRILKVDLPAVQ